MTGRVLYFLMGTAFTFMIGALTLLWDSHQDFRAKKAAEALISRDEVLLREQDLIGHWKGKESWGSTYTIDRRSDGTYSETIDTTHADYPSRPAVFTFQGRWAYIDSHYACIAYDAPHPIRGPCITTIIANSTTDIQYVWDEGNPRREIKQ